MVETIRVDVLTAAYLKRIKGSRSYSEAIMELAKNDAKGGEMTLAFVRKMEANLRGRKKENMSEHLDDIVYGVGRP